MESEIFVSPALLKEYRDTPILLRNEDKIDHIQLEALISGIASVVLKSKVIQPRQNLSICRDPEDNMLLECCLEAGADTLITGDKDLLDLKELPFNLEILTPREFVEKENQEEIE
ncbi:MAG: putative toxin-antitoxin system toxin component, PIN family [Nitrospirae bacterium RIFCSPLOW2_12_42_9]|nr:MAG: putative toxin-antitoxin system toxin component, PIN family [Nitrospirae bacterium RIFCSPHIGHO2_02_FULL_42_12]OGW57734.1 MAG: putative toxin-antitoxin system toxin component, PIN family [Nitrospirae bacterium RIFCSPLOW2_12_42_9]